MLGLYLSPISKTGIICLRDTVRVGPITVALQRDFWRRTGGMIGNRNGKNSSSCSIFRTLMEKIQLVVLFLDHAGLGIGLGSGFVLG